VGLIEAVILGIVQGLTEFLPVSSSAHLRVAGEFLPSGEDPGAAFTAIIQLGTESAVLLYFRKDIARIIAGWFRAVGGKIPHSDPDARMGWLVIIGTLPIAILGFLFQDTIETGLRDLRYTATTLIVGGILLGIADAVGRHRRELRELTVKDGIIFGFAQAAALIPGVSRSGGTITAGLFLGYTREAAARYSFLLAIPAVLASGLLELYNVVAGNDTGAGGHAGWLPTLVAALVAFAVGYLVIVVFLKIVSTYSYLPFVLYRIVVGLILFAFIWLDVVPATTGG
jgi:undecaprenyl-diphosphatase